MSRRLPIYFLVDTKFEFCSESLSAIENGLNIFINNFRQNPQLIETAHLSINSLSENNYKINELLPLENIGSIQLIHSTSCSLGKNISLLCEALQKEKLKTQHKKQDWTSLVFIFLLNNPDDDIKKCLSLFKKLKHTTVVILFDKNIFIDDIKLLTEFVLDGSTLDSQGLNKFFDWGDESILPFSENVNKSQIIN